MIWWNSTCTEAHTGNQLERQQLCVIFKLYVNVSMLTSYYRWPPKFTIIYFSSLVWFLRTTISYSYAQNHSVFLWSGSTFWSGPLHREDWSNDEVWHRQDGCLSILQQLAMRCFHWDLEIYVSTGPVKEADDLFLCPCLNLPNPWARNCHKTIKLLKFKIKKCKIWYPGAERSMANRWPGCF